jgi:hypothetical protein
VAGVALPERSFPEQFAGGFVEGAKLFVEVSCSDENEVACGNDGATVILGARVFLPLGCKFRIFAERNFPDIVTGVEIDGV